jgi:hypothetical protein
MDPLILRTILRINRVAFPFILGFLATLFFSQLARAHDVYTGLQNPDKLDCCGGKDCWEIPIEWISEDKDFFIVTFPNQPGAPWMEKMIIYSPANDYRPVKNFTFRFRKSQAMPTPANFFKKDGLEHSGYHACVWGGQGRCFWYPQGA